MAASQELALRALRSHELDGLVRKQIEVADAARVLRAPARRVLAETLAQAALRLACSHGLTDAQIREEMATMQGAWRFSQTLDTAIAASENDL